MTTLRYMTPNEEKDLSIFYGFHDPIENEIVLSQNITEEEKPTIVRHEIGHKKFNIPNFFPIGENPNFEKFHVNWLFNELMANYFSLTINSNDSLVKQAIKDDKREALNYYGMSAEQISRLDKVARNVVGYTGKEVK